MEFGEDSGLRSRRCAYIPAHQPLVCLCTVLGITLCSAGQVRAQRSLPLEVPVDLLVDHLVDEGWDVLLSTKYPANVLADDGRQRVAPAGSFLYCKAKRGKGHSLALADCQMFYQPVGEEKNFYTCKVITKDLHLHWHGHWWEFFGNASETWQAVFASFSAGSTAQLFTRAHWIMAVSTAGGLVFAGIGPFAKHHPRLLLRRKCPIPESAALMLAGPPGQAALNVRGMAPVPKGP